MAKKVEKSLKLQIEGGKASPAPPIGIVLGPTGINIGDFCSKFNEKTKDSPGSLFPVILNIYADRSFDFVIKKPTMSNLIKKMAGVDKGSGKNAIKKVGSLTKDQVKKIAEEKLEDLNACSIDSASKIVEGTARSMGIDIKG